MIPGSLLVPGSLMAPGPAWEGFSFARPAGLWALLAPVLLWLVARERSEPPALATGAFALWRELGNRPAVRTKEARRCVPPAVRFAIAALSFGALAAAGPRFSGAPLPRTWVLLVDQSPSTSLALDDGRTRLEQALAGALDWLASRGAPGDRVSWRTPARSELELPWGERPPPDWLAHPRWFAPEPDFALADRSGTAWVTDRMPFAPANAACFASGGARVAGPVASSGLTRIDWDGGRLIEVEDALSSRPVTELPAGAAPRELEELFALWALERGFSLDRATAGAALVFEAAPEGPDGEAQAGRDGWTARGRALAGGLPPEALADPAGERWLEVEGAGGTRETLVFASPGRVRVAWRSFERVAGDPAAFALSWSRLFDRVVLPPPGIVPLAERQDAGQKQFLVPELEDRPSGGRDDSGRIEGGLALAAALCALAAAGSAGPRRA